MPEVAYKDVSASDDVPMKRCPHCPEGQQWHPATTEFYGLDASKRDGLYSLCRVCKKEYYRVYEERRKERHRTAKEPIMLKPVLGSPEQCGSCGTTSGNIFGDIDSSTMKKHGYLCMKCYKLVRDFGADPQRLRNVLAYVEKTRTDRACS